MSQEDANTMKVKVSWLARKHRGSSKNIAWLLARGETPYLRIDLEFSRRGVTNFCRLYESDKGLVFCRNERLNLISSKRKIINRLRYADVLLCYIIFF